jgi:hypothetical protein
MYQYLWNEKLSYLCGKIPTESVCKLAVKLYIGSFVFPKNTDLAFSILEKSAENTNDLDDQYQLKFSKAYLTKLHGMETGNQNLLDKGNKQLHALCQDNYPPALVRVI